MDHVFGSKHEVFNIVESSSFERGHRCVVVVRVHSVLMCIPTDLFHFSAGRHCNTTMALHRTVLIRLVLIRDDDAECHVTRAGDGLVVLPGFRRKTSRIRRHNLQQKTRIETGLS